MARPKRVGPALRGVKYYLSDEAIRLLVAHCAGTPMTMSAYLDQLIKTDLSSPQTAELRPIPMDPVTAELKKLLDEGRRQIAELTTPVVPPMTHTDIRAGTDVPRHRERIEDQKPVPNKKDFDLDI
jgi:hypothetical protein